MFGRRYRATHSRNPSVRSTPIIPAHLSRSSRKPDGNEVWRTDCNTKAYCILYYATVIDQNVYVYFINHLYQPQIIHGNHSQKRTVYSSVCPRVAAASVCTQFRSTRWRSANAKRIHKTIHFWSSHCTATSSAVAERYGAFSCACLHVILDDRLSEERNNS